MKNSHFMHIEPEYFTLLKLRVKKVEFRLNDEKRRQISVGDKIHFTSNKNAADQLVLLVSAIYRAEDFDALLQQIPSPLRGGFDCMRQLKELRSIYSKDQENEYGVVGFVLE